MLTGHRAQLRKRGKKRILSNPAKKQFHPRPAIMAGLFSCIVMLGACVSSQIEEFRHETGTRPIEAIKEFESVVVLIRRTHTAQETEKSFVECVSKKLQSGREPFRITEQAQFVDLMFPYFEPELAPNNPYEMPALLAKPGVLNRINDFGLLDPAASPLEFFSLSFKYKIDVFSPNGKLVTDWTINAYGKAPAYALGNKESVKEALMVALRDAAASLTLDFPRLPGVAGYVDRASGAIAQTRQEANSE